MHPKIRIGNHLTMLGLILLVIIRSQALVFGALPTSDNQFKHILVLYSYNFNHPAQQRLTAAIESARRTANLSFKDFQHEYLDISSPKSPEQRKILRRLLFEKYAGQHFDLIITVFDDALAFLLDEGADLSPNSPCLALYGRERPDLERGGKKVIQSPLYFDVSGTLDLALKLFPKTRKVMLVSGSNTLDKSFEKRARAEFTPYVKMLAFEYTSGRSMQDVLEQAARLPDKTIIIYGYVSADITGKKYSSKEMAIMLAKASRAPVFSLAASQLDTGVVGGSMVDVEELGAMLGRALPLLDRQKGLPIEPASKFAKPMVNWQQIERWKIAPNLLPKETVIVNRPLTLWNQYKRFIITTILVFLILFFFIVALIIENRRRSSAEKTARESEERYRSILQIAMDGFVLLNKAGRIIEVNDTYARMSGYPLEELQAMRISDLELLEDAQAIAERKQKIMKQGCLRFESRHRRKDGDVFDVEVSVVFRQFGTPEFAAFIRDITERKQVEEERLNLQAQLIQAQKMESIGRLAGGVAHDFNNMLGVIFGHADMIMEQMETTHPLWDDLAEIRSAAERSANLTRQLLAFARQQTVVPKVIDLNDTIEGMLKMLRRLIGENIDLAWTPGKKLRPVKMDPSQIDQILANLSVNARDAIAGVGKIVIETANAVFDPEYCAGRLDFIPGNHVMLAFSDDGCGIDRETLGWIFEPFFTTKEIGQGTGLGLATVYGIVKQNDGVVNVYSEPGQGTTFKIYLPAHTTGSEELRQEDPETPLPEGDEIILLVEDEPAILKLTALMLQSLGYSLLTAAAPNEALLIAQKHIGEIHLLMTDVIMPEMSGRDLAGDLLSIYPNVKCLFMSGYTANVIAHHGVLDKGIHFIQKPFSRKALAVKIREVLQHSGGL